MTCRIPDNSPDNVPLARHELAKMAALGPTFRWFWLIVSRQTPPQIWLAIDRRTGHRSDSITWHLSLWRPDRQGRFTPLLCLRFASSQTPIWFLAKDLSREAAFPPPVGPTGTSHPLPPTLGRAGGRFAASGQARSRQFTQSRMFNVAALPELP